MINLDSHLIRLWTKGPQNERVQKAEELCKSTEARTGEGRTRGKEKVEKCIKGLDACKIGWASICLGTPDHHTLSSHIYSLNLFLTIYLCILALSFLCVCMLKGLCASYWQELCVCASGIHASYWSQAEDVGLQAVVPATVASEGPKVSSWKVHNSLDLKESYRLCVQKTNY